MKIGYSTWGMPELPIDTILEHLAGLGFDGVEITVIRGYTTELDTLAAADLTYRTLDRAFQEAGIPRE